GRPYYDYARKGIEIPRPPRRVSIKSLDILSFEGAYWEARVVCSRGTYIRSLVEDIARALATVATVDALTRERVGSFTREGALSWDRLCGCNRDELVQLSRDASK